MSAAEDAVRELDALSKECDRIDGWLRSLRLGRQMELLDERPLLRRLSLSKGAYGGGWLSSPSEPLPAGMSGEFYDFLAERARDVGRRRREAKARLEAMSS